MGFSGQGHRLQPLTLKQRATDFYHAGLGYAKSIPSFFEKNATRSNAEKFLTTVENYFKREDSFKALFYILIAGPIVGVINYASNKKALKHAAIATVAGMFLGGFSFPITLLASTIGVYFYNDMITPSTKTIGKKLYETTFTSFPLIAVLLFAGMFSPLMLFLITHTISIAKQSYDGYKAQQAQIYTTKHKSTGTQTALYSQQIKNTLPSVPVVQALYSCIDYVRYDGNHERFDNDPLVNYLYGFKQSIEAVTGIQYVDETTNNVYRPTSLPI